MSGHFPAAVLVMQSFYPERFEREMGCTEAEWLSWLPRAIGEHPHAVAGRGVTVTLTGGELRLRWAPLEPRVLGLVRLPRLGMVFEFCGPDEMVRHAFMTRFDLYTQRGGG